MNKWRDEFPLTTRCSDASEFVSQELGCDVCIWQFNGLEGMIVLLGDNHKRCYRAKIYCWSTPLWLNFTEPENRGDLSRSLDDIPAGLLQSACTKIRACMRDIATELVTI